MNLTERETPNLNRKTDKNKFLLDESFYISIVLLSLSSGIIVDSNLSIQYPNLNIIDNGIKLFFAVIGILEWLSVPKSFRSLLFGLLLLTVAGISTFNQKTFVPLLIIITILSMLHANLRFVMKIRLASLGVSMVFIILLNQLGFLLDLTRATGRLSFGFRSYNTLAFYIFQIIVCLALLYRRHHLLTPTIITILCALGWFITRSRTATLASVSLLIMMLLQYLVSKKKKNRKVNFGVTLVNLVLLAIPWTFSIYLLPRITAGSLVWNTLNEFLSGRLAFLTSFLNTYHSLAWGQQVSLNFYQTQDGFVTYAPVDNSYIYTLIASGWLFSLFLLIYMFIIQQRLFTVDLLAWGIVFIYSFYGISEGSIFQCLNNIAFLLAPVLLKNTLKEYSLFTNTLSY